MANINDEFPSNYLKAADLKGAVAKVKIDRIERETIGTDNKLVLYFRDKSKGMVLNKTNARTIADAYGDETDNWSGADIEVFSMKVDFQGRMVDGLRIRVPTRRPAASPRIIPNARDDARMQAAVPPADVGGGDYDDAIPFAAEWR